ncbi:MAG: MFS transporter [Spirochaetales bacterium]|jgi:maltose/moltooligosaccharide transporter|nr:MFS transporter [Spirochaetales bacterium]
MKKSMKGYYSVTFLIGLGFFTMGLMDPLYDTYIPIFLSRFIDSKGLIGSVMTLDNLFALFLIPVVSALSDNTKTRIGRRMPYIIVSLPLAAVCFGLIPFAALSSLTVLIIAIFCLNVFKQAARGPVVALMPDTIPGEFRSEANGVINTMGGIAAIVGTVGLAKLMDVKINLPGRGPTDEILPFPIAGGLVILAAVALLIFIKEKHRDTEEEKVSTRKSLKLIFSGKDRSALLILVSLFFWFLGYQGILPFIGLYSKEVIGVSTGTAGLAAGMVAIAYAIFAIPSGIIAHRKGRKATIRVSLLVCTGITIMLGFHSSISRWFGFSQTGMLLSFFALLFVFGTFWVSIVTNSFPMLWQMASYGNMGIYTGLYYTFSQLAAIIAPPITGFIIDLVGFEGIFFFGSVCMFIAFLVMGRVTQGDVITEGDVNKESV